MQQLSVYYVQACGSKNELNESMLCFEFHNKPLNTHGLTGSVCVELVVKTGSVWVSVVVILLTGLITGSVRSEFVAKLVVEHAKYTGWPPCIRLARRARRSKSRVRGGQETPHSLQAASKRSEKKLLSKK